MLSIDKTNLRRHHEPRGFSDRFALGVVRAMRSGANALFGDRYGHSAVLLETIAAVPGMVAASLLHLKCLRKMTDDRGWIRVLMEEAENQRAHLMAFVQIARPRLAERLLILFAQGVVYNAHFLLYLISPATAHRIAGYIAEDAVRGYTQYLEGLRSGRYEDVPAPPLGAAYWNLGPEARLSDVVVAIREDEAIHRDVNHGFADALAAGNALPDRPAPMSIDMTAVKRSEE
jgi:ubiquinol oxidase